MNKIVLAKNPNDDLQLAHHVKIWKPSGRPAHNLILMEHQPNIVWENSWQKSDARKEVAAVQL